MFKNLKELFENAMSGGGNGDPATGRTGLELAAAVLMLEVSLADSTLQDEERGIIEQALTTSFQLSGQEALAIIELAQQEVDHSVSLYEFTSELNRRLTPGEKTHIIELLWSVAFADRVLDKYEEYYIRKIADLLYVSHQDYIKTKLRMMQK